MTTITIIDEYLRTAVNPLDWKAVYVNREKDSISIEIRAFSSDHWVEKAITLLANNECPVVKIDCSFDDRCLPYLDRFVERVHHLLTNLPAKTEARVYVTNQSFKDALISKLED